MLLAAELATDERNEELDSGMADEARLDTATLEAPPLTIP
jgi:hypothetical protein